ncbi:MAG: prepilin-type N-terminal cleavage/methylation domain-containing protein [Proteobacteria bacterium]|nr:prepilin-type N-terminal cleavage/methylation domain-containing protein [Pseudomonadota bacterium]
MSECIPGVRRPALRPGFTLIEIMISMLLATFVLAGAVMLFSSSNRAYVKQDAVVATEQNVRGAIEIMSHELRMAGYVPLDHLDPTSPSNVRITADVAGQSFSNGSLERIEEATANTITFLADLNSDGDVETVRYLLTGTNLTRQSWQWSRTGAGAWVAQAPDAGGVAQAVIVAENVTGVTYTYMFADGDVGTPDDTDGDSTNDREDIRAITFMMTGRTNAQYAGAPGGGTDYRYANLVTFIKMRNMGLDTTASGS